MASLLSRRVVRSFSTKSHHLVLSERAKGHHHIAVLTLHKPEKLNSMTVEMGQQFETEVKKLAQANDVRALIVTGAGRCFSAGGDLNFILDRINSSYDANVAEMRRFYARFLSIRSVPFPVVAAINGHAVGAGLCLSLAADVRVSAVDAKLGLPFVHLGLHPGMGASHYLPRLVGQEKAARLLLMGDSIFGDEAAQLGMVTTAVPASDVLDEAIKLAHKMTLGASLAVNSCVRTLRLQQDRGLDETLQREAEAQALGYGSEELAARMRKAMESTQKSSTPRSA